MNSFSSTMPWLLALLLASPLAACSEGGGGGDEDDTDSSTEDTDDTGAPPAKWVIEEIEDRSVGTELDLAVSADGTVGAAYFATEPFEDGICDEIEIDPPTRMRQELRYAEKTQGAGGWSVEKVEEPIVLFAPNGLSLAFDGGGRPAIAFTGGIPELQYCGGNDAVLAIRGADGWFFDTAGATSGEAATGDEASDSGFVVGLWPSLAFDPQGEPAILHKDAHFGAMQHDDKFRADAELAWRSIAAWNHEAVDPGEGAGDSNELIFDREGRPVAFYAITVEAQEESRHGVWAARRETDGTWVVVKIHTGAIHERISAAIDPFTGDVVAAFYSAADAAVKLRRLPADAEFGDKTAWTSELVGDSRYDEGQYVSLAYPPSGRPALAYHRCRRYDPDSSGCNQNDEAVIFAIFVEGAWKFEVIEEADRGSCGEYTSLGFDALGTAHVAYRCTVEKKGEFDFRTFVASKIVEEAH